MTVAEAIGRRGGSGEAAGIYLRALVLVLLIELPFGLVYFYLVEPPVQRRCFSPEELVKLGPRTLPLSATNPLSGGGQPLFCTGKMLILLPPEVSNPEAKTAEDSPAIHPAWEKLPRSLRATSLREVETLIRVTPPAAAADKKAGGMTVIHLFDLRQKRFIGAHVFSPKGGEPTSPPDSSVVTSALREEAVTPQEIADFLVSLPVRQPQAPVLQKPVKHRTRPRAFW